MSWFPLNSVFVVLYVKWERTHDVYLLIYCVDMWYMLPSFCSRSSAREVDEVQVREERPSQSQCGQVAIRSANAHFGAWSPHRPAHQLHVSMLKTPSAIL